MSRWYTADTMERYLTAADPELPTPRATARHRTAVVNEAAEERPPACLARE